MMTLLFWWVLVRIGVVISCVVTSLSMIGGRHYAVPGMRLALPHTARCANDARYHNDGSAGVARRYTLPQRTPPACLAPYFCPQHCHHRLPPHLPSLCYYRLGITNTRKDVDAIGLALPTTRSPPLTLLPTARPDEPDLLRSAHG